MRIHYIDRGFKYNPTLSRDDRRVSAKAARALDNSKKDKEKVKKGKEKAKKKRRKAKRRLAEQRRQDDQRRRRARNQFKEPARPRNKPRAAAEPAPPQERRPETTRQRLPSEFLSRVSNQVLEHTKQLGIFDELRMKLLAQIEARHDFSAIERDFSDEVEAFCRREADLREPRSKLRQQLNEFAQNPESSRLTRNLNKNIKHIIEKHKNELLASYQLRASSYLSSKFAILASVAPPSPNPPESTDVTAAVPCEPDLDQIPLPPCDDEPEQEAEQQQQQQQQQTRKISPFAPLSPQLMFERLSCLELLNRTSSSDGDLSPAADMLPASFQKRPVALR